MKNTIRIIIMRNKLWASWKNSLKCPEISCYQVNCHWWKLSVFFSYSNLLTQREGSRPINPPAAMFPSPPTQGVRMVAVLTPLDSQLYQLLHPAPPATSPPPPYSGAENRLAVLDGTAGLPATASLASHGSPPTHWESGQSCLAGWVWVSIKATTARTAV